MIAHQQIGALSYMFFVTVYLGPVESDHQIAGFDPGAIFPLEH